MIFYNKTCITQRASLVKDFYHAFKANQKTSLDFITPQMAAIETECALSTSELIYSAIKIVSANIAVSMILPSISMFLWIPSAYYFLIHNPFSDFNTENPVYTAVINNNTEVLQALLNAGAQIEDNLFDWNKDYISPLKIAIQNNNKEMVELLLAQKLSLQNSNVDALYEAMALNQIDKLSMFFELIDKHNINFQINDKIMLKAIEYKNIDLCNMLVKHGGQLSNVVRKDIYTAIYKADVEQIKLFASCGYDFKQESYICSAKNLKLIQALVEAGADINALCYDNLTPLQNALKNGNFIIAEYLLTAGADGAYINPKNHTTIWHTIALHVTKPINIKLDASTINNLDYSGQAAVHIACANNNLHALEILHTNNANMTQPLIKSDVSIAMVNTMIYIANLLGKDYEYYHTVTTPLQLALTNKSQKAVKYILEKVIDWHDPNQTESHGICNYISDYQDDITLLTLIMKDVEGKDFVFSLCDQSFGMLHKDIASSAPEL